MEDKDRIERLELEICYVKEQVKEMKDKVSDLNISQERFKIIINGIENTIRDIKYKIDNFLNEIMDFKQTFIKDEAIMIQLSNDVMEIKQEIKSKAIEKIKFIYKIISTVLAGSIMALLGYIISKSGVL